MIESKEFFKSGDVFFESRDERGERSPVIQSKLIPDMTHDELTQMLSFYGPDHRRTAKIAKEIARRAEAAVLPVAVPVFEPVAEILPFITDAELKQISRKFIPDMSIIELKHMQQFYGPSHNRAPKIVAEIAQREKSSIRREVGGSVSALPMVASRPVEPISVLSEPVEPSAVSSSLTVGLGDGLYPAESIEDAQAKWLEFRGLAEKQGATPGSAALSTVTQNGAKVGRIDLDGQFVSVDAQTFEGDAQPLNAILPAGAVLDRSLTALIPLASQTPDDQRRLASNFLREVTSETARKATYDFEGVAVSVIESAQAGEFAVRASGDTYGTFKIDEAGLVTSRRARAEWAKPWIQFASESFARDFGPKKVLEADTDPTVPTSGVVNDGPVRAGDVFTYGAGEAATVMRTLPGGKAEVRIQGTKLRVGETRVSNLKKLERLGRAEYLDGSYTTPAALIDAAKGAELAQDEQSIDDVVPVTAAGNDSTSAVQVIETKESYETPNLDQRSSGSLAGAPAEDVRATDGITDVGGDSGAGGSGNVGSDPGTDLNGDQPPGRLDAGERAVLVPARRDRADAGDGAKPGLRGARGADEGLELAGVVGGELTPATVSAAVAPEPDIAVPQLKREDFTITDELKLGEGGQKAKYKDNIAAIKLLVELEDANQMATPDQQKVLAKYVGWGGLAQAFDDENPSWKREYKELRELLSPEDFDAARKSTRYAHYTSSELIVDGIYAALARFGFEGGKTLEAGAGVGNFMGLMPPEMRSAGRFTAIEREPFAASIAKQLYPLQNVQVADFTEFKGTDAYYDAVVGNPPFASDAQVDMSGRKHLSGLSLHNYFFAKGVDMLREGGIMAQVVTSSFMDAAGEKTRKYISDRARLLGAIRLPNNAFLQNAGTEVTTDVIFLQKLSDAEIGGKLAREDGKRWLSTGKFKDPNGYRPLELNQYFIDNPDMMLGQFGSYGTMYGQGHPALVARKGQDTLALLKAAVGKLPANVYTSIAKSTSSSADLADAAITALENPAVKEGGYFVLGDKLMQRLPDLGGEARGAEVTADTLWTAKTKLGAFGVERIKALAALRTTTRGLIAAEMADDEMGMQILRVELNKQYDAYQVTYGMLNDPGTVRVFDDDPDFPLLASLEHGYKPGIGAATAKRLGVKETPSTATKSPIFSQRVVAARAAIMKAETPADALAVSMAERGKLDAAYIGELLGREPEEVLRELRSGEEPLLFGDPSTDEYVLRDAYLSGNVRLKLKQAREAGMSANIRALEAVQPADVPSHEIVGRLGAPWIPTKVYEAFAKELFGNDVQASVYYMALNSSFQVSVKGAAEAVLANRWGTPKYQGNELLQALMNNKVIKVTYVDAEKKVRTDIEASDQANIKAQEIKDRFSDWLFSDPDRSGLLTQTYNETNNNYVTRVYDGSTMTYPGKVPDSIIKHRRHQRDAASRIVQDRTALLDHVVGSGKTFTVVTGAMELKRTGLASKSMVAVPNHLVKQWAADFYRLYPGANVLTATKKDFEKVNRRKFLARIATGDWDAVVIAHSSYGFIRPSAEFESAFSQQEVDKVMATIAEVNGEEIDIGAKRRTVKQLEGIKEKLVNRIKALRDKPMDDLLDFGQLGVNQLFVDEAHMFKNLMYTTKMQQVQGLGDGAGSQRAYDMYIKCNEIMAMNGRDQGVVFATGTPVSNSLAEMYHMMRYLMPTVMKDMGFSSFDAWANTFASVEQVWMQAPSGDGFKVSNRMSNFVNTPELLKIFDQVCDTVTMDEIKQAYSEENDGAEFPIPKLKDGRRTPVAMLKSPAQDAYMALIADRARALENRGGPPKKGDDNILFIMGDARKCAMDIRLVDLTINEREKGGRIDVATDHAVANYHKFADVKGTQIIFSDLGTPLKHAKAELKEYEALQERIQAGTDDVAGSASLGNERAIGIMEDVEAAQAELDAKGGDWLDSVHAALRGFSVYDDYRAALIEKGIPAAEIAFIHDYNTDEQKAALFRKMNSGEMRFVLGSTAKLGAGTNVQERLVSEQHLDVPWRPSDVEQREGRIIRQGNVLMNLIPDFEIEVLAFVTKDTLDMRMWQTQEVKLKMINQLRIRKIGREVDNAFEDMELSAGEMQAAATGDINLLKEIQYRTEIKKLEQKRRSFEAQSNDLHNRKVRAANQLVDLPAKIEAATIESVHINAYRQDAVTSKPVFAMNIDGQDYADPKAAKKYLAELDGAGVETTGPDGTVTIKAAPVQVEINGEPVKSRAVMAELYSEAVGDDAPVQWTYNGSTYHRRAKIQTAIMKATLDCIAQESLVKVGTLGAYTVAIEATMDRHSNTELDVTLSRDGVVVMSRDFTLVAPATSAKAADRVIRLADSMMDAALNDVTYLAFSLQKAQAESDALQTMQDLGKWPDADKLVAVRAAHQEVLNLLKQKSAKKPGEENGTPGADSQALEAAKPLKLTPEITSTLAEFIEATGCELDSPMVLTAHQILSDLEGNSRMDEVAEALSDGDLALAQELAEATAAINRDDAVNNSNAASKPKPRSVKSASQFSTVEYP